jgi:membrane-associated phospholipid phosphatase
MPMGRALANYAKATAAAIETDRAIYLTLVAYCAGCLAYLIVGGNLDLVVAGQTMAVYTAVGLLSYGFSFPLLLLIAGIVHILLRLDRRRKLAFAAMFGPRQMGRVLAGTALMLAMIPFRGLFNLVKVAIPAHGGYLHDVALADFDKALHFGADPFHLLHAIAPGELALRIIELNYNNLWFVITFGALYWVAVSPALASVRTRFVVCFILTWAITGGIFAIVGSSAGPVYYGAITGNTARFADLVAFVDITRGQPGSASDYQHYLWDLQARNLVGLGSGISAFPSMHVAIITLLALFISEASRKWAIVVWCYVAFTVFSSVYLGWHYAIDGYAAIILTTATHFAVRKAMSTRWRWWPVAEAGTETA